MTDAALVLVDADRVQEYVFGPWELKLIRGASSIQTNLNFDDIPALLESGRYGLGNLVRQADGLQPAQLVLEENPEQEWELIYAAGGNVLVLFRDRQKAWTFAREAERVFEEKTGASTATAAVVRWTGEFGSSRDRVYDEMQRLKSSRRGYRGTTSNPFVKACEACGVYPATAQTSDAAKQWACRACLSRRVASQRSMYLEEVSDALSPPEDFESLAERARPDRYLGLVYVDVDKLGVFFKKLPSEDRSLFREWSTRVRNAVKKAVVEGCRAISPGEGAAPFEILLLGGDDAVVIMQAQSVLRFLLEMKQAWPITELTFSAGVVWAQSTFPIGQYLRLAKELYRSAKAEGGNRVDWLVVTEALGKGISEREKGSTQRPYRFTELHESARLIGRWKRESFPVSKVRELYDLAFEAPDQAWLNYLFLLSRLDRPNRALLLQAIPMSFWESEDGRMGRTAAADYGELWDFVDQEYGAEDETGD